MHFNIITICVNVFEVFGPKFLRFHNLHLGCYTPHLSHSLGLFILRIKIIVVFVAQFLSPHLTSSFLGPIFQSALSSASLVLKLAHKCFHVIPSNSIYI